MTKEERLVELLYSKGKGSSSEVEYLVERKISKFLVSYFQGDGCGYFVADGTSEYDLMSNLESLLKDTNIHLTRDENRKLLDDMGEFRGYEDMMECASEFFGQYGYSLVWLHGEIDYDYDEELEDAEELEEEFDEDGFPENCYFELCYGDNTPDDMVYALKIVKNEDINELEMLIDDLLPDNMFVRVF
ncbi:MAG: hypothetical protein R3Y05_03090 [bacterium]